MHELILQVVLKRSSPFAPEHQEFIMGQVKAALFRYMAGVHDVEVFISDSPSQAADSAQQDAVIAEHNSE